MPNTTYGDISPRTAAHAQSELLERAMPDLCLEKFGQGKPVPTRSTKVTIFRRYERFPITPLALTEGVTPSARQLTTTDITATLAQYGDRTVITDVINDTHEDPVLSEAVEVLSQQAAQMIETVRFNILKAGTNVFYPGTATARNQVNAPISLAMQRKIVRSLKRQDGKKVTRVVRSTPSWGTEHVNAAYVCISHPDCESDIRDMAGFVPVESYGSISPYENEIGKVEEVRYVCSTIFEEWIDAGGLAATNSTVSTGGTNSDVYPMFYVAQNSYGIVPLKGKSAITPMVSNPKPSDSDPMAQRGHVAWKCYQTAAILNDAWFIRAEVAVSELA